MIRTKKEDAADDSKTEVGGKFAPVAKEDLKVGVIHISDPAEGSGYTYTHDQGIVEMQKELGLEDSQIIRKNNIPGYRPNHDRTGDQGMYRGRMPDHFRHQL